jgi:hypothetical protein
MHVCTAFSVQFLAVDRMDSRVQREVDSSCCSCQIGNLAADVTRKFFEADPLATAGEGDWRDTMARGGPKILLEVPKYWQNW